MNPPGRRPCGKPRKVGARLARAGNPLRLFLAPQFTKTTAVNQVTGQILGIVGVVTQRFASAGTIWNNDGVGTRPGRTGKGQGCCVDRGHFNGTTQNTSGRFESRLSGSACPHPRPGGRSGPAGSRAPNLGRVGRRSSSTAPPGDSGTARERAPARGNGSTTLLARLRSQLAGAVSTRRRLARAVEPMRARSFARTITRDAHDTTS